MLAYQELRRLYYKHSGKEVPRSYEGVQNPLKEFLEGTVEAAIGRIHPDAKPLTFGWAPHWFSSVLKVEDHVAREFLHEAVDSGTIKPQHPPNSKQRIFDHDTSRALLALWWGVQQNPEGEIEDAAALVKESLGEHPLAAKINIPGMEDQQKTPHAPSNEVSYDNQTDQNPAARELDLETGAFWQTPEGEAVKKYYHESIEGKMRTDPTVSIARAAEILEFSIPDDYHDVSQYLIASGLLENVQRSGRRCQLLPEHVLVLSLIVRHISAGYTLGETSDRLTSILEGTSLLPLIGEVNDSLRSRKFYKKFIPQHAALLKLPIPERDALPPPKPKEPEAPQKGLETPGETYIARTYSSVSHRELKRFLTEYEREVRPGNAQPASLSEAIQESLALIPNRLPYESYFSTLKEAYGLRLIPIDENAQATTSQIMVGANGKRVVAAACHTVAQYYREHREAPSTLALMFTTGASLKNDPLGLEILERIRTIKPEHKRILHIKEKLPQLTQVEIDLLKIWNVAMLEQIPVHVYGGLDEFSSERNGLPLEVSKYILFLHRVLEAERGRGAELEKHFAEIGEITNGQFKTAYEDVLTVMRQRFPKASLDQLVQAAVKNIQDQLDRQIA